MTAIPHEPAVVMSSGMQVRAFLLRRGFEIVFLLMIVFYSLTAPRFLTFDNINSLLHAAAPTMVIASGLALVVMTGKLDMSVGSIAFVASTIGTILMIRYDVPLLPALVVILVTGAVLGALNGLIILVLRINPLIATMGTMIALRGVGLELTRSSVINLPDDVRRLGGLTVGPIFADVLIALAIMVVIHLLHTRTPFGRRIMAIGNDPDTAARLGVRVSQVTFWSFVLSGFLASIGGFLTTLQVGGVSAYLGSGLEFVGVSIVVIGGISLFGGEGSILPGVLRGALMLEIIRNGLNHLGADPYAYRFVNGGIIFVAMYADSLRSRLPAQIKRLRLGQSPK